MTVLLLLLEKISNWDNEINVKKKLKMHNKETPTDVVCCLDLYFYKIVQNEIFMF
jgi:hypothetical protein